MKGISTFLLMPFTLRCSPLSETHLAILVGAFSMLGAFWQTGAHVNLFLDLFPLLSRVIPSASNVKTRTIASCLFDSLVRLVRDLYLVTH